MASLNWLSANFQMLIVCLLIARERFELSSKAPEASMLGRYTTGLIVWLAYDPSRNNGFIRVFVSFAAFQVSASSSSSERVVFSSVPWDLDVRLF
jgi:hypothetical protein